MYWIIERILDSERECGEEIEIEYEGEEMNEKTIAVPAGTDKVTLNAERRSMDPEWMTLRQALMATPANRAVLVRVLDRPVVNSKRLAWGIFLQANGGGDSAGGGVGLGRSSSRRASSATYPFCLTSAPCVA